MIDGLVDTNVFIHAQTHDALAEECLLFLEAIQDGRVQARLDPLVLHELSYALPHYRKGMTRVEISEYLLAILAWEGFTGEKGLMVNAVERWRVTPRLAFVDAYFAASAARDGCHVYSKNAGELRAAGADVPANLPH